MPGPMHYSLYGLASCYTGVFEAMAAMQGTQLKKLTARVETDINFSKVFGVGDQPIMEEVRVMLRVVSDAPEEMIRKAVALALQRCPVVFTLRNPIRLRTRLEILREA